MSPERWHINSDLLGAIMSRTGGNPRSVIGILRDLVDEGRGLGSKGTLESLTSWSSQKKETTPDYDIGKHQLGNVTAPIHEPQDAILEETVEDWPEEEDPDIIEKEADDEDWDGEPDDMWPTDEGPQEESVIDEIDEEEYSEILPDSEITSENPEKITGWAADEGAILSMDEGTEPPSSGRNRGFSGLVNRSKITNDSMPKGPDYTVPILSLIHI